MRYSHCIRLTTGLMLLALTAGCQQFYTNDLTMQNGDSAKPAQAQTPKRPAPADATRPRGQSPGAVQFTGGASTASRPPATQPAGGGPGSLGLWGKLADGQPRRHRSLDAARNVQQVTSIGEGADFDPEADPEDGSIVFASTRHRETADLYRKQPGGHAITQLTSDRANDVMPALSPDGKRIAFASDRSGNWDIYVMDAAGGGKAVRLTDSRAHDLHPSFSPDGNKLVYSSFNQAAGQWQLAVVKLDAPGSRTLLGEGLFPTWAPDSDRILYQKARRRGTRWFSVWTVRYNGGEASAPTELAASDQAALITPEWGPNGKHVVFCTVTDPSADVQQRPDRAAVWMMNDQGGDKVQLTNGQFANLQPIWSPDGTIYFISDRGESGHDTIWSLQPSQPLALGGPDQATGAEDAAGNETAADDQASGQPSPDQAGDDAAPSGEEQTARANEPR